MSKPLTDAINALTTYANSVTGASDTTLSEAVATLANGYGQGGGKSDMNGWTNDVAYTDLTIIQNEYVDNTDGSFDPYNGWYRTGYVPINGASFLILPAMSGSGGDSRYNAFYTESQAFISAFNIRHGTAFAVNVPSNAYYFVLSEKANMLNEIITSGVRPIE